MLINALIFGKLWEIRQERRDPNTDVTIAAFLAAFMLTLLAWPILILIPADTIRIPRIISWALIIALTAIFLLTAWPVYLMVGFVIATAWLFWFVWKYFD